MCKRLVIYSHDTYGLGHLRRAIRIAEALGANAAGSRPQVLIITGSPREFAFPLPDGCDLLKLPSVLKQPSGAYASRSLGLRLPAMIDLRSRLIEAAVDGFDPDAILVDHAPFGIGGELGRLLQSLRGRGRKPRVVLGLRDVIDDVVAMERAWANGDSLASIEEVYDSVLVYGDARLPTTAMELDLERVLGIPVEHVGMLVPSMRDTSTRNDEIVVTCGGGGDAKPLLRSLAGYLESSTPGRFRFRVVTGPLLSRRRRQDLLLRMNRLTTVEAATFDDDLCGRLTSAAGVISMGGYNSVMEILGARTPALIAARTTPRREQIIRARRLEARGVLRACELEKMTPEVIAGFVDSLDGAAMADTGLNIDGLANVAARLEALLDGCEQGEHIDAVC